MVNLVVDKKTKKAEAILNDTNIKKKKQFQEIPRHEKGTRCIQFFYHHNK